MLINLFSEFDGPQVIAAFSGAMLLCRWEVAARTGTAKGSGTDIILDKRVMN